MNYTIIGKKKQFKELYNSTNNYLRMFDGNITDILNRVSMDAFLRRKDELKSSFELNNLAETMIHNIVVNIGFFQDCDMNPMLDTRLQKRELISNLLNKLGDAFDDTKTNEDNISMSFSSEEIRQLSYICDTISRFICGQTFAITDAIMEIWRNFHEDDVNKYCYTRTLIEGEVRLLHCLCWITMDHAYNGIHYNEQSDLLYDMHQVFRHALWEELPQDKKKYMTVDSDTPRQISGCPLLTINKEKE